MLHTKEYTNDLVPTTGIPPTSLMGKPKVYVRDVHHLTLAVDEIPLLVIFC